MSRSARRFSRNSSHAVLFLYAPAQGRWRQGVASLSLPDHAGGVVASGGPLRKIWIQHFVCHRRPRSRPSVRSLRTLSHFLTHNTNVQYFQIPLFKHSHKQSSKIIFRLMFYYRSSPCFHSCAPIILIFLHCNTPAFQCARLQIPCYSNISIFEY